MLEYRVMFASVLPEESVGADIDCRFLVPFAPQLPFDQVHSQRHQPVEQT